MIERRRVARRAVSFGVQMQQGDLLIDGFAQDYSPLGLKFRADVAYDQGFCSGDEALESLDGTSVFIKILDHNGMPISSFPAEIRWSQGACCGVENMAMSMELAA